jgi:hypothetical protein
MRKLCETCASMRQAIISRGGEAILAGRFVDYVDHLEHHLRKMLG